MLGVFIHLAKSLEIVCQAPLKTPPPVENARLLSAGLVFRHGMRVPYTRYKYDGEEKWNCDGNVSWAPRMRIGRRDGLRRRYHMEIPEEFADYPTNCREADLTNEGMEMHHELGEMYHDYFVKDNRVLPDNFDPSLLTVRCTRVERTLQSAVSFLSGMYPPKKSGEEVVISTWGGSSDALYPDKGNCPDMEEMYNKWINSDEYKNRMKQSIEKYKAVIEELEIPNPEIEWQWIGDWIISYYCKGMEIPDIITQEIKDQALNDTGYANYGYFSQNKLVAASPIWRTLLNDMDLYLAGVQRVGRVRIYSSHDITIMAILTSLDMAQVQIPPFRSHFLFELWLGEKGKLLLRMCLDGEPIPIPFMNGETVVEYSAFKTKLGALGYLSYCLESSA